ncbi:hypothetical protein DFJ74DRAFT_708080 [Hyaloraphidium curvatum]|nr:hypothetical protein DFJ74DRAFT_708080 [Hyaloraphidium curvatum]
MDGPASPPASQPSASPPPASPPRPAPRPRPPPITTITTAPAPSPVTHRRVPSRPTPAANVPEHPVPRHPPPRVESAPHRPRLRNIVSPLLAAGPAKQTDDGGGISWPGPGGGKVQEDGKPASPARVMLEPKTRCGGHCGAGRGFWVLVVLGVVVLLTVVIAPTAVVFSRSSEVEADTGSPSGGLIEIPLSATTLMYPSPTPVRTTRRTTTKSRTTTTTTTRRTLPAPDAPLPRVAPLPPAQPIRGCVVPGTMALTFDDGPSAVHTARILDVLGREGVPATFFINGRNDGDITREPWLSIVRRMPAEGHAVASHTWSHRVLPWATEAEVRSELAMLENATWHQYGFRAAYFRPPQGKHGEDVRRLLGEHGYRRIVMWNVDTEDFASREDPEPPFRAFLRDIAFVDKEREGAIVLMHDLYGGTARGLVEMVVKWARGNGWRLVPLHVCLGDRAEEVYKPGARPINEHISRYHR